MMRHGYDPHRDGEDFELEINDVLRETDRAVLVETADGEEMWLPLSQIRNGGEVYEGCGETSVILSLWIAEQKGLV